MTAPLPQTLGEMRARINAARTAAIIASRCAAGRFQAIREDIDAGDEIARDMAIACGFWAEEGGQTWLGRRAALRPETVYSFDPAERALVASLLHDFRQVERLSAQSLAVVELTATEMKECDRACREHEARIEAAVAASPFTIDRIAALARAELAEKARIASETVRRSDRSFMQQAA